MRCRDCELIKDTREPRCNYHQGYDEAMRVVLKTAHKLGIQCGEKMAGKYRKQGIDLLILEIKHIKNKERSSEGVGK